MPTNHQFIEKVNAEQLVEWATHIGPQTAALVSAALNSRPFPQQAYRTCLGILSFAKKHNHTLMELASRWHFINDNLNTHMSESLVFELRRLSSKPNYFWVILCQISQGVTRIYQ